MTALAAAGPGPAGSLAASLTLTRVAVLPADHFAARPGKTSFGCFAKSPIPKGTVLGIYWGGYLTHSEVERAQKVELTPMLGRARPAVVLEYLFDLTDDRSDGAFSLVVDGAPKGVRCWGGTINALARGGDSGDANCIFLSATRGVDCGGAAAPQHGLLLPMRFCVATRDIPAGAEARRARCSDARAWARAVCSPSHSTADAFVRRPTPYLPSSRCWLTTARITGRRTTATWHARWR
jgi:hypothetical protein